MKVIIKCYQNVLRAKCGHLEHMEMLADQAVKILENTPENNKCSIETDLFIIHVFKKNNNRADNVLVVPEKLFQSCAVTL